MTRDAEHSLEYPADFGTATPPGATTFVTAGGITVTRTATRFDPALLAEVTRGVQERRGGAFSSGMEYPGRYSRWHMGYVDPCAELVARGRAVTATALNARGAVLLPAIAAALARAAGGPGGSPPRASAAGGPGGSPPRASAAGGPG